jgi:hypothetical protein
MRGDTRPDDPRISAVDSMHDREATAHMGTRAAVVTGVPAMQDSGIPLASVLIALGVIAVVAYVLWSHHRRNKSRPEPSHANNSGATDGALPGSGLPSAPVPPASTDVLAFLVALGEAMIDSGDPVTHVRSTLTRVAEVNGVKGTEIIVLATALIVSVPG